MSNWICPVCGHVRDKVDYNHVGDEDICTPCLEEQDGDEAA